LLADYATKKELLVFLYYLLEFADSSLIYKNGNTVEPTGSANLLEIVIEVVKEYHRSDPHLV